MSRRFALVILLTLFVSIASATETIKIALIDPFTGTLALQGETSLRHIQMAAGEINSARDTPGARRIEIIPLDNKGSPQEALVALRHAISLNVHFVMQGVGAHIAHALTEAIAKHNERNPDQAILYLNYSAPDPVLTNEKCNFWHFRFESHIDMKLDALTTALARDPNIRRVYLINQDYSYGQRVARIASEMMLRKRPGIQIAGDELHPLAKIKDFAPYAGKIKASGADTILTGNWGTDLSLLIRANREFGVQANYFTLYAHLHGMGQALRVAVPGSVKNVANWYINGPDDRLEPFYLAYQRKYREEWLYAPSRTALKMLVQAVQKSGSADPIQVAHALEDMRLDAGTGEVWMRPDDHQIIQSLDVATLTRLGTPGVKYEFDNSGMGWRVDTRISANDIAAPTTCKMQRP